jgi:hypothetical protein
MDAGGLAGCLDGEIVTVWRRERELFRCKPGEAEQSLGRGQQAWAAAGQGGAYLVWIVNRPGALMMLRPGATKPEQIADSASDPVVAGAASGNGSVVAVWEEGRAGSMKLRAMLLSGPDR